MRDEKFKIYFFAKKKKTDAQDQKYNARQRDMRQQRSPAAIKKNRKTLKN